MHLVLPVALACQLPEVMGMEAPFREALPLQPVEVVLLEALPRGEG